MNICTDNGLKLEIHQGPLEGFTVKTVDENTYILQHSSGLEIETSAEKLKSRDLDPIQEKIFLSDEDISRLNHETYINLRNALVEKVRNHFSKIFENKHRIISTPKLFVLESPGLIYWGHSIAGQGNICLGGILEAWERSELQTQDGKAHTLYILSLSKGLSGYSIGKAYNPKKEKVIDITSPLLTKVHFQQLVNVRNKYSKCHDKNSLIHLNTFLDSLI